MHNKQASEYDCLNIAWHAKFANIKPLIPVNKVYKPFSPACERNQPFIGEQLQQIFAENKRILEIGSGTGQHAVYFAQRLPHIHWQCSDQTEYLDGIERWRLDSQLENIGAALELDVTKPWPKLHNIDGVFSANTLHIMNNPAVEDFFKGVGDCLIEGGKLVVYGPFKYQGMHTSDSNRQFDQSLQQRGQGSAIRDIKTITTLAVQAQLQLQQDIAMPANNRLLVFKKSNQF